MKATLALCVAAIMMGAATHGQMNSQQQMLSAIKMLFKQNPSALQGLASLMKPQKPSKMPPSPFGMSPPHGPPPHSQMPPRMPHAPGGAFIPRGPPRGPPMRGPPAFRPRGPPRGGPPPPAAPAGMLDLPPAMMQQMGLGGGMGGGMGGGFGGNGFGNSVGGGMAGGAMGAMMNGCPPVPNEMSLASDNCKDVLIYDSLYFPNGTKRYPWVPVANAWDPYSLSDNLKDMVQNVLQFKVQKRGTGPTPKERLLMRALGDPKDPMGGGFGFGRRGGFGK